MAALAVAGCTVNIGVPAANSSVDSETSATVAPPSVDTQPHAESDTAEVPDAETVFVEFMKREAPMTYSATSERDLIAGGYTVCTFFRDGSSGREVVEAMGKSAQALGMDTTESVVLIYGAVQILCPEYSSVMTDLG